MNFSLFKKSPEPEVAPMPKLRGDDWGSIAPAEVQMDILFERAERFGNPWLMRHDNGTYSASVKMHVAATGVTFEVKSEFNVHRTARAALTQMLERAELAIEQMSSSRPE